MANKPDLRWLFFGFSGRIARQSYALAISLQLILFFLAVYWSVAAGEDEGRLAFAGFAFLIVACFNLCSSIALTVKRLNDVNIPAILAVLLFVPAAGVLMVLFLMIRESHPETNRHGPPPFGPAFGSRDR